MPAHSAPCIFCGSSRPSSAPANHTLRVWSWAHVLWPAVVIHGTFDTVAMLFPILLSDSGLLGFLGIFAVACVVLATAAAVLAAQFTAVFASVAAGVIPMHITCGTAGFVWRVALGTIRWALGCSAPPPTVGAAPSAAVVHVDPITAQESAVRPGFRAVDAATAPHAPGHDLVNRPYTDSDPDTLESQTAMERRSVEPAEPLDASRGVLAQTKEVYTREDGIGGEPQTASEAAPLLSVGA